MTQSRSSAVSGLALGYAAAVRPRTAFVAALLSLAVGGCGVAEIELLPLDGETAEAGAGPEREREWAGENDPVESDAASTVARSQAEDDAGALPSASDAGRPAESDAGESACTGERVFGLCWHLAAQSQNCQQACSGRGGFDERAISYVGTSRQGGSIFACAEILGALGLTGVVLTGTRDDQLGLGCHTWNDGTHWWLDDPALSPSFFAPGWPARVACACAR